jgi:hypothetical protein
MAYVSKELREFWEERDPIAMYQRWLTGRAGIEGAEIERIDNEAAQRIEAAVEYADSLPFPKSETVTERLFAPSPHDPKPEDRKNMFEPIETTSIPALTASNERKTGEHFEVCTRRKGVPGGKLNGPRRRCRLHKISKGIAARGAKRQFMFFRRGD